MKKIIKVFSCIVILLVVLTFIAYFVGSGFLIRSDVGLHDYSVSEDGSEITLRTSIWSSMGFTRGFKDNGGGVKPHYLIFYSTFGGLNSDWGAKDEHILKLGPDDCEIYFNRAGGGYELVLVKDETGKWGRP